MTKGSCIKDWGTLLALTELLLVTHLCSIDGTVSLELPSKMKLAAAKRFGIRTAGRETTAAVIGWHLLLDNKIPGHFSILVSNDSSCLSRVKEKKTEESKMKLVRSNRTNLTARHFSLWDQRVNGSADGPLAARDPAHGARAELPAVFLEDLLKESPCFRNLSRPCRTNGHVASMSAGSVESKARRGWK